VQCYPAQTSRRCSSPSTYLPVAYYRVSTQKQGRSGLGIQAQREAVAHYLDGGAWQIIAEFTEVESGRRKDRPEFDRALAAARLHRAPLVVAKVDRLTRSVSFLSRLLEAGVDVRFADLPSIEGPTGRFMLQQMASVAELEAGLISTRTKAALAAAKARGKKLGATAVRCCPMTHARAAARSRRPVRTSARRTYGRCCGSFSGTASRRCGALPSRLTSATSQLPAGVDLGRPFRWPGC
jgi:DNA invertase Pin-like site-specific DNA recombinase